MAERSEPARVRIESTSGEAAALARYQPYAVGTLVGPGAAGVRPLVLIPGAHRPGADVEVDVGECLSLPVPMDARDAVLVPPLAVTFALWDSLGLELGDLAVWTAGGPLTAIVGQVALWRGACPGIELGTDSSGYFDPRQVEYIELSDTEAAAARLAKLASARPGFAAVDLSGRADLIDALLEVIPRWGRLLLAGPPGSPITIDYYRNVHRKGIVLATTVFEPFRMFDTQSDARNQVARACAVLSNPRMAAQCRSLLGASASLPATVLAVG